MKTIDELKMIEMENYILELEKVVEKNRRKIKEIEKLCKKRNQTNNIMNESIDFLELPARTHNSLVRANIKTIEKLCSKTYWDMFRIRGLGETSLKELVRRMDVYDLHFAKGEE